MSSCSGVRRFAAHLECQGDSAAVISLYEIAVQADIFALGDADTVKAVPCDFTAISAALQKSSPVHAASNLASLS